MKLEYQVSDLYCIMKGLQKRLQVLNMEKLL